MFVLSVQGCAKNNCSDYQEYKSEQGCKVAGKMAVEGKDYTVIDGDVMHFRFNV